MRVPPKVNWWNCDRRITEGKMVATENGGIAMDISPKVKWWHCDGRIGDGKWWHCDGRIAEGTMAEL